MFFEKKVIGIFSGSIIPPPCFRDLHPTPLETILAVHTYLLRFGKKTLFCMTTKFNLELKIRAFFSFRLWILRNMLKYQFEDIFRYVLEFGRINHIVVGQNALLVIYST